MMATRRRMPRPFAFIMAAVGNAVGNEMLRHAFATPQVERVLQPVISIEHFNASSGGRAAQLLTP